MSKPHPSSDFQAGGPKVTLDQLLQLKRKERPPEAFWGEFDRGLRHRQLAALATPESWHQRLARVSAVWARRFGPAAAGLASIALAVAVMYHVNPAPEPQSLAAAPSVPEAEARVFVLPEEAINLATSPSPSLAISSNPRIEISGTIRSAPPSFASGSAGQRRFVAVTAPVTISSVGDASAIVSARALTAGILSRARATSSPESL